MKKAISIAVFSFLALAPFSCAQAQEAGNPATVKAVEKSPAGEASNSPATAGPAETVPATTAAPATRPANENSASGNKPTTTEKPVLTDIYNIGVGDVLDIRLLSSPNNRSTLYSVIEGGLIDLPIAGGPIMVAGLTTKDIQARITSELKRLAVDDRTQVAVGVRQYGSHAVVITGLAGSPGTKFLRREAVPLYVLLAEVQPRLDATRVAVIRAGALSQTLELADSASLNFLIRPGDVLNLTVRPQEFYYIGGRIEYPGQKTYQSGITLIQAILAAGGLARDGVVELSREGVEGRLMSTRFNLKDIKAGKIEDPKLRSGDRVEVLH